MRLLLFIILFAGAYAFADVELHQPKIILKNLSLFTNSYINNVTFSTGTVLPSGLSPTGCQWGLNINPPYLVVNLISCVATGDILMEDGTFILDESGAKIAVE